MIQHKEPRLRRCLQKPTLKQLTKADRPRLSCGRVIYDYTHGDPCGSGALTITSASLRSTGRPIDEQTIDWPPDIKYLPKRQTVEGHTRKRAKNLESLEKATTNQIKPELTTICVYIEKEATYPPKRRLGGTTILKGSASKMDLD